MPVLSPPFPLFNLSPQTLGYCSPYLVWVSLPQKNLHSPSHVCLDICLPDNSRSYQVGVKTKTTSRAQLIFKRPLPQPKTGIHSCFEFPGFRCRIEWSFRIIAIVLLNVSPVVSSLKDQVCHHPVLEAGSVGMPRQDCAWMGVMTPVAFYTWWLESTLCVLNHEWSWHQPQSSDINLETVSSVCICFQLSMWKMITK